MAGQGKVEVRADWQTDRLRGYSDIFTDIIQYPLGDRQADR